MFGRVKPLRVLGQLYGLGGADDGVVIADLAIKPTLAGTQINLTEGTAHAGVGGVIGKGAGA